jgi:hypothetical protein
LLERGEGDRLIILLSDGESADLGTARSRQIAAQLAVDQIVLYAIHIGDRGPPSDLFELARPTGGQVFAANNPEALHTVFGHIDQMQPVKSKPAAAHQVDAFGPFAWAGLAVLGLLQTALFGLRYTPW